MKVSAEMQFAEKLGIHVASHLREPVVPARENREGRAERQHIVEVRDDIICILDRAIDARIGEHHASDAADCKQKNETDGPQQWCAEFDEPPHMVAIQEKTLMPVGTAITMLERAKKAWAWRQTNGVHMVGPNDHADEHYCQ